MGDMDIISKHNVLSKNCAMITILLLVIAHLNQKPTPLNQMKILN